MFQSILLSVKPSYIILLVIAATVILSFTFNRISKKTNIPSVLMLIALGVLIGVVLQMFNIERKFDISDDTLEIIGLVGLAMIVLEAALDLELSKEKWPIIWKSFMVALLSLLLSTALVAVVIYVFGVTDVYTSLLYAIPLSIMSSAIIIPSVGGLTPEKKEFMVYESAFSDILGIMFFYFLKDGAQADGAGEVVLNIFLNITVTIITAVAAAYLLVIFFQRLTSQVKLFLVIAVLIFLMVLGKLVGLSSLVIILFFGLAVNNRKLFFRGFLRRYLDEERMKKIEHDMHVVTLESSFLVRTFFFVVFGLQIKFSTLADPMVALKSVFIVLALFAVRWVMLKLFVRKDIFPQLFIAPRGLITILLFYDLGKNLKIWGFEDGVLLYSIIFTSIIMTWALIKDGKGIMHTKPELAEKADGLKPKLLLPAPDPVAQAMMADAPVAPAGAETNVDTYPENRPENQAEAIAESTNTEAETPTETDTDSEESTDDEDKEGTV